jgi:hypothetical protein
MRACKNSHIDVAEHLVLNGADINAGAHYAVTAYLHHQYSTRPS